MKSCLRKKKKVPNQPNLTRHLGSLGELTPGKHVSIKGLNQLCQAYYSERRAETLLSQKVWLLVTRQKKPRELHKPKQAKRK